MRKPALLALAAGLVAFAGLAGVPWLQRERVVPAAVPSPPAVDAVALVVLQPGQRACMSGVAVDRRSEEARFRVGTYGRPGPRLELTLAGEGWRTRATAGRYADNEVVALAIDPPPRDLLARACIANRGRAEAALYSAADRARSRAVASVDGARSDASPGLSFWERRPVRLRDRLGLVVERMATFRGVFGREWLLWVLLALFCCGLPLAVAVAIASGLPREAGYARASGTATPEDAGAASPSR